MSAPGISHRQVRNIGIACQAIGGTLGSVAGIATIAGASLPAAPIVGASALVLISAGSLVRAAVRYINAAAQAADAAEQVTDATRRFTDATQANFSAWVGLLETRRDTLLGTYRDVMRLASLPDSKEINGAISAINALLEDKELSRVRDLIARASPTDEHHELDAWFGRAEKANAMGQSAADRTTDILDHLDRQSGGPADGL